MIDLRPKNKGYTCQGKTGTLMKLINGSVGEMKGDQQ